MIVPSIDLQGGRTVQLVGGETLAIDAGDPRPLLAQFALAGEVAVVDLDAARGEGSHRELITELCHAHRVRVGGGIRDYATAVAWLDAGAARIVIGTAAEPALLARLPRERVVVALDERGGEVVTHGWRQRSGRALFERLAALRSLCGGFLVTFVEREGRLQGTDLARAAEIVRHAGDARVTIAGGVTTADEVAALDRMGADAQVGMALYTGRLSLADAIAAPLVSDRADGLWPTVVVDELGTALGLCWSNAESLRQAVQRRRGIYHSRSRGLWVKGESSGAWQELLAVDLDCDRDALRFTVRQHGDGFCHLSTRSCWGDERGLGRLSRRLAAIAAQLPPGELATPSNTARLLRDPSLLEAKLVEEAHELAAVDADVRHEAADLFYFALVRMAAAGVGLADVAAELDRRERRVSRRACSNKEPS
ncbi:MAG: HisA/HisF-related TIM barrel protein [Planctomycetes bacterium]|jgi:phosphoribosyl-ATP pyrophosphohydrolase|nr:HisA/HisF-related TIM barrel protein [Planctomycetota bacterium]